MGRWVAGSAKTSYILDVCKNSRHGSRDGDYVIRCEAEGKDREADIKKDLEDVDFKVISVTRIRKKNSFSNFYTYEVIHRH